MPRTNVVATAAVLMFLVFSFAIFAHAGRLTAVSAMGAESP
jgi:hypothetical protein